MDGKRIILLEAAVSIGINMWGSLKKGYWPWPATFIRTGVAFGLLLILSLASEEMAALLGGAFLLAQILKQPTNASGDFMFTGGLPQENTKDFPYVLLKFGSAGANTQNNYSGGLVGGINGLLNQLGQATGQPGASVGGPVSSGGSSTSGPGASVGGPVNGWS